MNAARRRAGIPLPLSPARSGRYRAARGSKRFPDIRSLGSLGGINSLCAGLSRKAVLPLLLLPLAVLPVHAAPRPVRECIAVLGAGASFEDTCRAVRELVEIGPKAVGPLCRALKDPNKNLRTNAALALGRIGEARALKPLLATLTDSDADVRSAAAEALGRLGDARALPALIARLSSESEMDVRGATVGLGALGSAKAVESLTKLLSSTNWEVRWRAAIALGQIGDKAPWSALGPLAKDSNAVVKAGASWALGVIVDRPDFKVFAANLKSPDDSVVWGSAWALGVVGTEEAARVLEAAYRDGSQTARDACRTVLLWLDTPATRRAISQASAASPGKLRNMDLEDRWLDRYGRLAVTATEPFVVSNQRTRPELGSHRSPRLFALPDGNLLLAVERTTDRYGDTIVLSSRDKGRTWQVTDFPIRRLDAGARLDDGTGLLYDGIAFRKRDTTFVCRMCTPDPDGKTLSTPELAMISRLDDVPTSTPGDDVLDAYQSTAARWTSESCSGFYRRIVRNEDGTLIACAQTRHDGDMEPRCVSYRSTNDGRTWVSEQTVAADGLVEPVLARCTDGKLLCLMRTDDGDEFLQAWSIDGGKSWMEPIRARARGRVADLCLLDSDIMACSYAQDGIRIMFSVDGTSKSWTDRIKLDDDERNATTGTSLCEVEPGRLLLVYDTDDTPGEDEGIRGILAVYVTVQKAE